MGARHLRATLRVTETMTDFPLPGAGHPRSPCPPPAPAPASGRPRPPPCSTSKAGGSARWTRRPRGLATPRRRRVRSGDKRIAVKDPIVRRGADGVGGVDLLPPARHARPRGPDVVALRDQRRRPRLDVAGHRDRRDAGTWDARGARITAILPDGRAAYDGRATAEENWFSAPESRSAATTACTRRSAPGRSPTPATSRCSRSPAAGGGSTTRLGSPMRATSCARAAHA